MRGKDPGHQWLFHAGQLLEGPQETLRSAGIGDGSTVYCIGEPLLPASPRLGSKICRIANPENRGITLRQLKEIGKEVVLRCEIERWRSSNSTHQSLAVLKPDQVTLYDLAQHYILPSTEPHKCSYVELVAREEQDQKPVWFVSHWWGESVLDFVASICRHAFDRGLPDETSYWVCAYALNQHSLGLELGRNPMNAPFHKALKQCKGMVSVLDKDCICYSRIWCCFELSLAIGNADERIETSPELNSKPDFLYDIYTVAGSAGAVGLNDGEVVPADKYHLGTNGTLDRTYPAKRWQKSRHLRQSCFPYDTLKKAMDCCLENGSASRAQDKKRILHLICGNGDGFDEDPPASHAAFDRLNAILWGRVVAFIYRRALENEEGMDTYNHLLSQAPLRQVYFGLGDSAATSDNEILHNFAQSLPTTLEMLHLDLELLPASMFNVLGVGLKQLLN